MNTLPELGYEYDALEPFIDAKTMEIHHSKHHQAYIDKLNAALEGHEDLQAKDVNELIKDLDSIPEDIRTAVQNHGGGHSNHSFFWKLLKKDTSAGGKEVQKELHAMFQSGEAFEEAFTEAAMKVFGSGWAWVVFNNGKLEITTTPNQDSPLSEGKIPIIGIDLWEHSYYLKHQNKRPDYIKDFLEVLNWDQAEKNYLEAKGE